VGGVVVEARSFFFALLNIFLEFDIIHVRYKFKTPPYSSYIPSFTQIIYYISHNSIFTLENTCLISAIIA